VGEARRRRRAALLAGHPLKVEPKFQVRELKMNLPRPLFKLLEDRWEKAKGEPDWPDSLVVFAMARLLDGISYYDAMRSMAEKQQEKDNLVQLATVEQQARLAINQEVRRA